MRIQRYIAKDMWPERANESLERAVRDAERVRRFLSQMLLAQGYQDLSGQIIQAVIRLVMTREGGPRHDRELKPPWSLVSQTP